MAHANARLTVYGRRLLVDRVRSGYRVADVAAQLGCSRTTVYKWLARFRAQGHAGLSDRSSRPRRMPTRTSEAVVTAILQLRRRARRGQDWIGAELGLAARSGG